MSIITFNVLLLIYGLGFSSRQISKKMIEKTPIFVAVYFWHLPSDFFEYLTFLSVEWFLALRFRKALLSAVENFRGI